MRNLNSRGVAFLPIVLLFAGAAILVVGSALGGYYVGQKSSINYVAPLPADNADNNEVKKDEATVKIDEAKDSQLVAGEEKFLFVNLPQEISQQIVWQKAEKLNKDLKIFKDKMMGLKAKTDYYVVGKFKYNNKDGRVIFADGFVTEEVMGGGFLFEAAIVEYDSRFILIKSDSIGYENEILSESNPALLVIDRNFSLSGFSWPEKIYGENSRQVISYSGIVYFSESNNYDKKLYNKIFTDKTVGDVYDYNEVDSKVDLDPGIFYVFEPSGRSRIYFYEPDFILPNGVPEITWNDGVKNDVSYNAFRGSGGCGSGSISSLDVVKEDELNRKTDLEVIGKNSKGDDIYDLKDKNHSLLRKFYDERYFVPPENKMSYNDFVVSRPLFLWDNPFGQLVRFTASRFAPAVECGKPVIYLYPPRTMPVKVKLELSKWSYSEPAYNGGWEVVAEPNGQLTETKTQIKYPYLFWEGLGKGDYQTPTKGFVVKKDEVSGFLRAKLAQIGLNQKETADFMEFWAPKMQKSPYYFVTFMGTAGMNRLAPLSIEPRPDTVLRVLMDYQPLNEPIAVVEPQLSAPERKGFTVVEWGGVLGRE